MPAISARPVADPALPGFAAQDAIAYVTSNPIGGKITANTPALVENGEFLPSREVAARLRLRTGMPDDALLCLVTLRGDFTVSSRGRGSTSDTAYQVFDARTGNLLIRAAGR